MKEKGKGLWTKDFTCITAATVLSAIGGEAMNLPVSLLVFDETKSTFLAALVMVCGMLPDTVFPIFIAPLIDKGGKKRWIVGMDIVLAVIYLCMGLWVCKNDFSYGLYLVFTLAVGTVSVFYRLAYSSWYPDLITAGMEQKGYAVSTTLYPLITIIMAPIATFLYEKVEMGQLFLLVSGLTAVSVAIESCIREVLAPAQESYRFTRYCREIKEGFAYLKKEKGIRNIYAYMSITNGTSAGISVIVQAYYQTQPWLTVTMLGFLKSAEMIGRVIGGAFQYTKEIPVKKRFAFTKFVYFFYEITDMSLLFLPYPLMLAGRFICGGLGISSATIRESAVQCYLEPQMRARVNAFFNVAVSVGCVVFQLAAGLLGQVLPYRAASLLLGFLTFVSIFVFIVIPAKENRPVYEAVRE